MIVTGLCINFVFPPIFLWIHSINCVNTIGFRHCERFALFAMLLKYLYLNFLLLDESFILISSACVSFFWLAGQFLFYTIGVFFSRLIGKPLFNHATIAWFSFIQKTVSSFTEDAAFSVRYFINFFRLRYWDPDTSDKKEWPQDIQYRLAEKYHISGVWWR